MKISSGSKLVMIGDSITDGGRAKPVGEGLFEAEGKGYVALVNAVLGAVTPERRVRVVNMGTSGNTVLNLKERWQTDVLDLKPDWLSIMIGINDVWRQFDSRLQKETHVLPKAYEKTLEELVVKTLPSLKGLVLMTPFYIESNRKDAMRVRMEEYGAIVKKLAKKHGAILVDTQAAFDAVLKNVNANGLAWDRVHPNLGGHMILARAFLKGVGFRGF